MKTGSLILVGAAALLTVAAGQQEANALDATFGAVGKSFAERFTFGSYGELHSQTGDGNDNLDLHRMVALMNFQVNDKLKFVSEVEFEHALYHDEAGGEEDMEIEVEQAYFEYALADDLSLTAGIQLIPVGIINQLHEPTTFYGVERPNVEKYLIPSTWWESAVGVSKRYDNGLQLDAMLHSGMDMTSNGYIRSGRPKMDLNQYTENQSWAVTTRAKYTGIAGVELAGSLQYQDDVSTSVSGSQKAYMAEAHAIYRKGGFELRGLATYWNINGLASGESDDQWGYYIEPSYSFEIPWGKLGYFARFSQYDYYNGRGRAYDECSVGLNYWPTSEVVVKTDYTNRDNGSVNDETINFGLGYYF